MLTGSGQGMAPVTPAQQFGSGAGRGIKKMLGAVMPGADFRSDFEVYKDDLESATGTREILVVQRDYARSRGDTAGALEAQMKIDALDEQRKTKVAEQTRDQSLRTSLIDLHYQDYEESFNGWGYSEKEQKQKIKKFKQMTLNQLCCEFDWDYQIITDEQAKEYEY